MGSSDNKFCLKWNDFEQKISSSFRDIRRDSEFFDVTLCCNNGEDIIQAHKLILAACSPLLKKILNLQANQNQPFLYLKGVGIRELEAILNFMYYGEANVEQDLLDNFLTLAEELEVKGKLFSKVKLSFSIWTTFEFSRLKLDTKLLKNGTFQSISILKCWILPFSNWQIFSFSQIWQAETSILAAI